MKQELILIKVGEIALKGLNRRTFEDVLMKNIKRHLAPLGKFEVRSAQSTIYVRPLEEGVDLDDACESRQGVRYCGLFPGLHGEKGHGRYQPDRGGVFERGAGGGVHL